MKTNVMQWGNSLAIRIPKSFAKEIQLETGAEVEMSIKGTSLVITKPHHNLKALIEGITPKNLHSDIDTGISLGNEQW